MKYASNLFLDILISVPRIIQTNMKAAQQNVITVVAAVINSS